MRHRFKFFFAFVLMSSSVLAQKKVELGLVVRPTFTSIRGDENLKDFSATLKWSFGLQANYFLTNKSAIYTSLIYDPKGAVKKTSQPYLDDSGNVIGTSYTESDLEFNYLSLPIQWKSQFGSKIKLEFGVGVYFSYLLEQHTRTNETTPDYTYFFEAEETNQFKKLDCGASLSFGVLIPISDSFYVRGGLDGNFGLIDATKKSYLGSSLFHNSMGLNCSINYRFWH
jgi:Outer membrane protein beta-barrel domain